MPPDSPNFVPSAVETLLEEFAENAAVGWAEFLGAYCKLILEGEAGSRQVDVLTVNMLYADFLRARLTPAELAREARQERVLALRRRFQQGLRTVACLLRI